MTHPYVAANASYLASESARIAAEDRIAAIRLARRCALAEVRDIRRDVRAGKASSEDVADALLFAGHWRNRARSLVAGGAP